MASLKISQLTNGNPAVSADILPVDRSGSNVSITAGSIAAIGLPALATAGQGWFFGGIVLPPFATTLTPAVTTASATQVRAVQFVLPFAITISKVAWEVQASAGDHVGYGIYSADGQTRLLTTGAVTTVGSAAGQSTTLASPVTLPAGVYWFAWCQDGTPTTTIAVCSSNAIMNLILNASSVHQGTSNQVAASGVLPTSLGTITGAQLPIPVVMFSA